MFVFFFFIYQILILASKYCSKLFTPHNIFFLIFYCPILVSSYSLFSSRLDTLSVQRCFSAYFERSKLLSELLLPFVRRSLGFLLWRLTSKSLLLSETCRSLDIFSIWNILCKPWTWLCGKILVVVSKIIKPSFLASTIIQQSLKSFFFLLLMLGLNFSESSLFNSYALLLQYTNCTKSSKSVVHFPGLPIKKTKFMQLQ